MALMRTHQGIDWGIFNGKFPFSSSSYNPPIASFWIQIDGS
jgi:hypothetical protein